MRAALAAFAEDDMPSAPAITELLAGMARGDAARCSSSMPSLTRDQARGAHAPGAKRHAAGLNTTALVHEGFAHRRTAGLQGESRGQFFAYGPGAALGGDRPVARRGRDKRGGDAVVVTLSAAGEVAAAQSAAVDLIGLDQALSRMRELDAGSTS